MKDLTPKVDDTVGPTGQLVADDYNDSRDEAQNLVENTGQTLTAGAGDDVQQLTKAVAIGGTRKSRADAETADLGDIVLPDNSSAPLTIKLPLIGVLFVNGTIFFEPVIDQLYSVNALTIGRNGQKIMGLAEDFVMNSTTADNQIMKFSWKGDPVGWVITQFGLVGTTL